MKTFLALFLLTLSNPVFSQQTPESKIQIVVGRGTHSTGDMTGLSFATEYEHYLKKRLSWSVALGGTIHDGFEPMLFKDQSGGTIDNSIRYTTAGLQIASHLGYDFVRTTHHEVQLRAGGLLRYQSSSYFDELQIIYPIATGLPMPVNYFVNKTPQRTYAVGASCQLLYNYTFENRISIGFLGGFQIDSNGDNISQLSFTLGKRF
ncbi:MAG: hypothetical protein ABIN94_08080 [Ferruginibacter sp.]